jgi:hypothetical protein
MTTPSTQVVWHERRDLTPDLFRCDLPGCGDQANTIHFVPWYESSCEVVLFACPRHNPGGYVIGVEEYVAGEECWRFFLEPDTRLYGDRLGLELLLDRVEELTNPIGTEAGATPAA